MVQQHTTNENKRTMRIVIGRVLLANCGDAWPNALTTSMHPAKSVLGHEDHQSTFDGKATRTLNCKRALTHYLALHVSEMSAIGQLVK